MDIVPHQTHARVSGPALLALVTNNIFEVGVRLLGEEPLDEIPRFLSCEPKEHPDLVDVPGIQTDRMLGLGLLVPELEEVIWRRRRTGYLTGTLRPEQKEIQDETIVLEYEGRKLQAADHAVTVDMAHVFVREGDVLLGWLVKVQRVSL